MNYTTKIGGVKGWLSEIKIHLLVFERHSPIARVLTAKIVSYLAPNGGECAFTI